MALKSTIMYQHVIGRVVLYCGFKNQNKFVISNLRKEKPPSDEEDFYIMVFSSVRRWLIHMGTSYTILHAMLHVCVCVCSFTNCLGVVHQIYREVVSGGKVRNVEVLKKPWGKHSL